MTGLLAVWLTVASASPSAGEGDVHDLVRVDVRGTRASMAAVRSKVEALSEERRQTASRSLAWLVAHDPYTEVALALPFALEPLVAELSADHVDRLVHHDLSALQAGLADHVALLEALGVAPVAAEAPLAHPRALLAELPTRVEGLDEPTRQAIHDHSERVEAATGQVRPCPRDVHTSFPAQPWTLGMHLGGWHDALRRLEPFVTDAGARAEVEAMIALLDAHAEAAWR